MDDSAQSIARLPTPAPSDHGGSGRGGPSASTSTSFLTLSPSVPPAQLAPSTSSNSMAYLSPHHHHPPYAHSHVLPKSRSSLSLNFSAWEAGAPSRFISALPSPSISNAGSVSDFAERDRELDTPPASVPSSTSTPAGTGSKTSSFFSASFAATPPPPPLSVLPQRSVSVSVRGKHADANSSSGQIFGLSSTPAHAHAYTHRSVSAERSPARADSANAIFFSSTPGSSTPAPPPPLRPASPPLSDTGSGSGAGAGEAGPSKPRVSLELYEEDLTPKAEAALRRRDGFRRPSAHAHTPSTSTSISNGTTPARRKIILLDEPETYTTSPDGSPIRPTHAHAHPYPHLQPHPHALVQAEPMRYEREYRERPRAATINNGSVPYTPVAEVHHPALPAPTTAPAVEQPQQVQLEHHSHAPHLHREPHSTLADTVPPHEPLRPGLTLASDDLRLTLLRVLGQGAFSSVWLASDASGSLACGGDPRERRKSESFARTRRDRRMAGLTPGRRMPSGGLFGGRGGGRGEGREGSVVLDEEDGEGGSAPVPERASGLLHVPGAGRPGMGEEKEREGGGGGKIEARLVAVKCLDRAMCEANDRTRISFVREVEVLRHVSHPSIVSYLHSFTTPTHHCLVLEYLAGGELFSLLDNDEKYGRMTEPLVRRMFGELVRAVGWMHGVALVHRDIKLENILLTCDPFSIPSFPSLDDLPSPLLKLSDFGLSRFIDPSNPLLQTRCGSESYAAPEIVMGQKYDGRQTDAWACGVVLYALATRVLPFDPSATDAHAGTGGSVRAGREGRKALLFRIAKGDYTWPKDPRPSLSASEGSLPSYSHHTTQPSGGPHNLATPGLKRVVSRLLVRDPAKRAKVIDLWDEEWMLGPGAPAPPHRDADTRGAKIVDGDSIGDVARNEVV